MTNVTKLPPRVIAKCEYEEPILQRVRDGEISMKDAAAELAKVCNYSIDHAWRTAKSATWA